MAHLRNETNKSANSTKQSGQKIIDSGPRTIGFRALFSDRDQFDYDCCLYALLHRELSAAHWWDVLIGKFSAHKGNWICAISRSVYRISTLASALFRYKVATMWFIPKMKGLKVGGKIKRSTYVVVSADEFYDINIWDVEALPDSRTVEAWNPQVFGGDGGGCCGTCHGDLLGNAA